MKINKEINPAFEDFIFNWNCKTYLAVGGYGSSKSYHVAIKIILKLLEEKRTCLVVREVFETIRDSTYSLFEEIIEDMNLTGIIKSTVSPMQFRFPNGSKIIFKGMDKPGKLRSINDVTIVWLEEASEIKYAGYKELLGRARHPYLSLHFILSTNPVGKDNWVYTQFFIDNINKRFLQDDKELYKKKRIIKENIYYHHSTADDNLFLPLSYIEQLEELKEYDPDLYRVARKGYFGVNGTKVLPQFKVMEHEKVINKIAKIPQRFFRVGMDFGFEESFNAIVKLAIDDEKKDLYIYFEYYKNKMTDDKTSEEMKKFISKNEIIYADAAEPKTITYYQQEGFKMIGSKGEFKRISNIKKVKRFKNIYCSENCINTIAELKDLTYKSDSLGNPIYDEFTIDPHTFKKKLGVYKVMEKLELLKWKPERKLYIV